MIEHLFLLAHTTYLLSVATFEVSYLTTLTLTAATAEKAFSGHCRKGEGKRRRDVCYVVWP